MNEKLIKNALKKALHHYTKTQSFCDIISEELQPFFNEDISVLYQMGDGFVVLHEPKRTYEGPLNTSVMSVVEFIKEDPNRFKDKV